jgi:twinkle protein
MLNYLRDKGFEFKLQSGQAVLKICPYCGDQKFHFYCDPEKNVFFCHKCNEKGNEFRLKRHLGDIPSGTVKSFSQIVKSRPPTKKVPQNYVEKLHGALMADQLALDYLFGRGLTTEAIKHFKLGLENGEVSWIAIPYFKNGECVNIKFRSLPPAEKTFKRSKDGESALFNQDCINGASEIILTEGELDAISAWQAGHKNVVSISNGCSSFLPEWVDALDKVETIYLWYDNDEKGLKASREVAERLGLDRCYPIQIDGYKDANEYFLKNGEMDLNRFGRYEVENVSLFLDAAFQICKNRTQEESEITVPWKNVSRLLCPIERGDLIVPSAVPKTGKTSWCLNIATHNAKNGHPVLFYCLEMRPERLAKKVIQAEGHFTPDNITEEAVKAVAMRLASMPLYFAYNYKTVTLDTVTSIIRQAVRRYGIKLLVFDNLHYLSRSTSHVTQEIGLISRTFKLLAEELNIPVFLIAQPRKVDDDHVISMNDLKDSSSIGADADQVIILYRKRIRSDISGGMEAAASYEPQTLIRVDASRYGPGGDTVLTFEGQYSKFTEIGRNA